MRSSSPGVNLGCFRDRAAGMTLAGLIRAAGATTGVERLRLSSIEINHVDGELVAALHETPVVGPTCTCRSSPATTPFCAQWRGATRSRPTSASWSRSPTIQPHEPT